MLCGEFIRRPASVTRVVLAARGAVYHITHDLHCKATREYIQICGHHAKLTRARYYLFSQSNFYSGSWDVHGVFMYKPWYHGTYGTMVPTVPYRRYRRYIVVDSYDSNDLGLGLRGCFLLIHYLPGFFDNNRVDL